MLEELFVEVEDVPMGVSLTQNGNKAKDVSLETEPLAISCDQTFGR